MVSKTQTPKVQTPKKSQLRIFKVCHSERSEESIWALDSGAFLGVWMFGV
jgi:hypothetical protein